MRLDKQELGEGWRVEVVLVEQEGGNKRMPPEEANPPLRLKRNAWRSILYGGE